jgi:uncharacterized protein YkuJ
MKKMMLALWLTVTFVAVSQKKSNGTIYIEHPAINVVEAMTKAFVSGDADKVGSYLTDDFKAYNGTNNNPDDKGQDKATFLKDVTYWKENVDYLTIKRAKDAYPDALEYKEQNDKSVIWVQTWEDVTGVHNKTGVKINMPIHRLYIVDKNNKIKTIISYTNSLVGNEIGDSFASRKNGEIYNHHEYINSVRKMMYAFEHKDFDKAYGFYDDKATFIDNNQPDGKTFTLTEQKANDKKMFDNFELLSIDVTGYPDYLHYELGNQDVVQSWWTYRLERKSDKKKIALPVFLIHNFDDKGKITAEIVYYGEKLLEAK